MADLRLYHERQFRKLQDAVYARRGWDEDGVPTIETVKAEGMDFPELVDLIGKHAHKA